jgi:C-terminal processing protease CtpA/Prc
MRADGRTTVHSVVPGSPAEGSGIQCQDRLVGIDGTACADMRLDEIRRLLAVAGTRVALTIERDGKQFDVAVVLREYWRDAPVAK